MKRKSKKKRKKRKEKRKRKEIENISIIALGSVIVALTVLLYFSAFYKPAAEEQPPIPEETTTTTIIYYQGNCGDMQIDVNAVTEATNYYRFGIQRPATENSKFVILNLTVENRADTTKDFSGYRIELLADNKSYIPLRFDEIERMTLSDNSTLDYNCRELALAYISRFELDVEESATGCKIFQILEDLEPESLSVYDLEGLKCRIPI